jgi:uncharacterized membrane protein SirB2
LFKQGIFGILWVAVIVAELFYRQPLFNYSMDLQRALITNAAGQFILEGISLITNGALYYAAFMIMFNWRSRARAFYYLFFLTSCGFIMNITKMAYHEPRPFMIDPKI